jgi:hypothetical protein
MRAHRERGFSFVSLLLLAGLAAGGYWIWAFGPAHWENREVIQLLREAANLSYQQQNDKLVRDFILRRLDETYGYDEPDGRGRTKRLLRLQFEPDDLVLERTQRPPSMRIQLSYLRTITLPLVGSERILAFSEQITQDLSVVKY